MNERRRISRRTRYTVNGIAYERLDQVPEQYRHLFADADGDGIPDIAQGARSAAGDADDPAPTDGSIVERAMLTSRTTERIDADIDSPEALRRLLTRHGFQVEPLREGEPPATIHCFKCGYDLAGTPVGGNCPECAHPVRRSIHAVGSPPATRLERWFGRRNIQGFVHTLILAIVMLLGWLLLRFIIHLIA